MTDSDRPNGQPVAAVGRRRRARRSSSRPPRKPARDRADGQIPIPELTRKTTFDVGYWPPWREPALFSFEQLPGNLSITVSPT